MEASTFEELGLRRSRGGFVVGRISGARLRLRAIGFGRGLIRLGISERAGSQSADTALVGELEVELSLLREENARLKVERHRLPDAGRVVERMRELSCRASSADGQVDQETWQALAECLTMRDGLLAASQDIQQAMMGMRQRLTALAAESVHTGAGGAAATGTAPAGADMDLDATEARETSSADLAMSLV
jgi:hypothetical protein